MKKKWTMFFLSISLISACQNLTSFKKGNMNIAKLYDQIVEQGEDEAWRFPIMNQQFLAASKIEKMYDLDMTKISEAYVKSALIPSQIGEIAIFKIEPQNIQILKAAIDQRILKLHAAMDRVVLEAESIINNAKQGKIGAYYYFIVGSDSKKVVNYISTL